ncbi:MAG: hypothetical protein E7409_07195 [Ruminococcaceae bacterium]|nr:hypothetical protein [Oscillospiraceae bacterium]
MKKVVSMVLTVAMLMSMCLTMPAFATMGFGASNNNVFSVDFESGAGVDGQESKAENFVTLEGDTDQCFKLAYDGATKAGASWRPRKSGNCSSPLVTGKNIKFEFDFRVDSSSDICWNARALEFAFGTASYNGTGANGWVNTTVRGVDFDRTPYLMLFKNKSGTTKCALSFMGADGTNAYTQLCEVDYDTWTKITMYFDLENGKYSVYANGKAIEGATLFNSEANQYTGNVVKTPGFLEANFINTEYGHNYSGCSDKSFTYYIDDVKAEEVSAYAPFDFEDANAAIADAYMTKSGSASIVSATDKDGNPTKALSIVYNGLGKGGNPDVTSTWALTNSNGLVTGTEVGIGFDFRIDNANTKAGDYDTRNNPGYPTLFPVTTAGGETTPLVAARFTRERGEYPAYYNGPYTWEIQFADGRLNYIGSGVEIGVNDWASIYLALHLEEGTYDAYINDAPIFKGLKLEKVDSTGTRISNTSTLKALKVNAINSGHYNADTYSSWGVLLDNITYDVWTWDPNITSSDAKFLDASDAVATAGKARTYQVTVNNPNTVGEYTWLVVRAVDEQGKLQGVVFDKVLLEGGTNTIKKTIPGLAADGNYEVKAFFINPESLTPYSVAFPRLESPLAE